MPCTRCMVLLAIAFASTNSGTLSAQAVPSAPGPGTEILWDTRGIPHVFSDDPEALFHAFGWAQMHSHADAVLRLYGQARGRAAEYWGEAYLKADHSLARMGTAARAESWYAAQEPEFRRYLDAFAAGMNAYARAHPERIGAGVEPVLPVKPTDVLARLQELVHIHFLASPAFEDDEGWARGSNGWAVAPVRAEGGSAMLLMNPHLPWTDFNRLYEAQLVGPGVDVYGVTMLGLPFILMGFNEDLGWTHTINTIDGADMYELRLTGDGYHWNEDVLPFDTVTHYLRVNHGDGRSAVDTLHVLHSVHGPVVWKDGDRARALRVTGLDQPHIFQQYLEMARAHDLDGFERAARHLQMPLLTTLYADRAGNILHLFGGRVPVRSHGDWAYWAGTVRGDTSATLWTATHPYDDLPRVLNPRSGWLQNANDPPWVTTFPVELDPDRFPSYLAPRTMDLRAQRSAGLLLERERIGFADLIEDAHSSHVELATRVLDPLLAAAREKPELMPQVQILEQWDRTMRADSRGALLFLVWARVVQEASGGDFFAEQWNAAAPLTTPNGLADTERALAALGTAGEAVMRYGEPDAPWGEVFRLRIDDLDLPASGGPGSLGAFRVMGFARGADGRFVARSGETFVAAVEFGDPVRARTRLIYGNATQPGSPHRSDQLTAAAEGRLLPVWRTRAELAQNLSDRTVF